MATANEIVTELEAFYKGYIDAFNREDIDMYSQTFDYPYAMILGDKGLAVCKDETGHQRFYTSLMINLKERGWARSGVDQIQSLAVCREPRDDYRGRDALSRRRLGDRKGAGNLYGSPRRQELEDRRAERSEAAIPRAWRNPSSVALEDLMPRITRLRPQNSMQIEYGRCDRGLAEQIMDLSAVMRLMVKEVDDEQVNRIGQLPALVIDVSNRATEKMFGQAVRRCFDSFIFRDTCGTQLFEVVVENGVKAS